MCGVMGGHAIIIVIAATTSGFRVVAGVRDRVLDSARGSVRVSASVRVRDRFIVSATVKVRVVANAKVSVRVMGSARVRLEL